MRAGVARALGGAALVLGTLAGARVAGAQTAGHLQCIAVEDALASVAYTADVSGLVLEPGCRLRARTKLLCAPAVVSNVTPAPPGGGGTGFPNRFLCYKVVCPRSVLPTFLAMDRFGIRTLSPRRASTICTPAMDAFATTTTTTTIPPGCVCDATGCCKPPGGACVADVDCCRGTCGTSSRCSCGGIGQACTTDHDCCFGWSCDVSGHCACVANGSSCSSDGECCGRVCNAAGTCACDPEGTPCSTPGGSNARCCTGFCDGSGRCGIRPDHLQCFTVRDPEAKASYTADLLGIASTPGCEIHVPARVACLPAGFTNVTPPPPIPIQGSIPNPFVCYRTRCEDETSSAPSSYDEFGFHALESRKTKLVCAPGVPSTTTTSTTLPPYCGCDANGCCLPAPAPCTADPQCCSGVCDAGACAP